MKHKLRIPLNTSKSSLFDLIINIFFQLSEMFQHYNTFTYIGGPLRCFLSLLAGGSVTASTVSGYLEVIIDSLEVVVVVVDVFSLDLRVCWDTCFLGEKNAALRIGDASVTRTQRRIADTAMMNAGSSCD